MFADNRTREPKEAPSRGARTAKDEEQAASLLEEYEQALQTGKDPRPKDYLNRYGGADRESLIVELNLVSFFWNHGKEVSRALRRQDREETARTAEVEAWKQAISSG